MRSLARTCFAVATLLALGLAQPSPAVADELVKFASAASQTEGIRIGAKPSQGQVGIQGYLTRPKGDGPFPGIVVLHSCLGIRADRQSMGREFAGWGYVALFVDDFATRNLRETCAVDFPEALSDALGGLAFLGTLPYVNKTRIAALGYSQGGDTALKIASSASARAFAMPDGLAFRAAAAFYPPCENQVKARLRLPTLILVGDADTVTPAAACEQMVGNEPGADVKLVVYRGAGHVFDDPAFAGGKHLLGMWLQFDQSAAAQSQVELRDFLAAKLGR